MFLYNCENITLLTTILFAKSILNIIFLIIPIVLIVMITIDVVKMVVGKEDDFKKITSLIMKRLIAVIVLFFVPMLVTLLLTNIGEISDNKLACYDDATTENIERLEKKNVDDLINSINQNNITLSDINKITKAVSKISDTTVRKEYEKKLNEIKTIYNKKQDEKDKQEETQKKKNKSSNNSGTKHDKSLFVGDSRTVGMCMSVSLKSADDCSIAKESMGYSWFVNTALPRINTKLSNDQSYNVFINMGTNDLGSTSDAGMYASKYNDLKRKYPKANIIAVSVGPIDDSMASSGYSSYARNTNVVKFNQKLKQSLNSNVIYCDVYSKIRSSFTTTDGIHYTSATYQKIFNELNNCI